MHILVAVVSIDKLKLQFKYQVIFVNTNIPPSQIVFVVSFNEVIKAAYKYLHKIYPNAFGGGVDGVCHEYVPHVTLPHMSTCPKYFVSIAECNVLSLKRTHTVIHTLTNKYFSHTREMLSCLKQLNGSQDHWHISDS